MFIYYLEQASKKEYLYHATYRPLLKQIKLHGLDPNIQKKNWDQSKNVIYLATDPYIAESYAETNDVVDEDWLDQIVVLKIDKSKININSLSIDENNQQKDTLQYTEIIPWGNMKIINLN